MEYICSRRDLYCKDVVFDFSRHHLLLYGNISQLLFRHLAYYKQHWTRSRTNCRSTDAYRVINRTFFVDKSYHKEAQLITLVKRQSSNQGIFISFFSAKFLLQSQHGVGRPWHQFLSLSAMVMPLKQSQICFIFARAAEKDEVVSWNRRIWTRAIGDANSQSEVFEVWPVKWSSPFKALRFQFPRRSWRKLSFLKSAQLRVIVTQRFW